MPELKCYLCGGTIVQDYVMVRKNIGKPDGCHCTNCGIKFQPNLEELSGLIKDIKRHYSGRRCSNGS